MWDLCDFGDGSSVGETSIESTPATLATQADSQEEIPPQQPGSQEQSPHSSSLTYDSRVT